MTSGGVIPLAVAYLMATVVVVTVVPAAALVLLAHVRSIVAGRGDGS